MTTTLQQLSSSQANAEIPINENFASVAPAALYARDPATSGGLTWGYKGGRFNGATVADGTVALTASTTNYVVANRATGAVSTSTATTNWNNQADYLRLYSVVCGAASVTSSVDERRAVGGPASGTAVLVAGTVTVACAAVTAGAVLQLTSQADGGTPGWLRVSARTPGTSFTVTSSSGSDTSTVGWTMHL